jgi:glyoxylase-like metal-dependent hydrolase (beta-lactamase superfamily II)
MKTKSGVTKFRATGWWIALLLVLIQGCGQPSPESLDAGHEDVSGYNNDPFVKPETITPLTLPDAWPTNIRRDPHDLSPPETTTKLITLGTGMPSPNPYRAGPSHALVVNGSPFLVDAGEGIWRSIAQAALINGDEVARSFSLEKLKYLFITHLHQDHTVGIPSLLLNPSNWIFRIQQEVYGPRGTEDMLKHILAAWKIDQDAAIADGNDPAGGHATGHDIIFEEHGVVYQDDNVKVEAFRTKHASLSDSFAYRFTTQDRIVVFTGDGGPYHPNIIRTSSGQRKTRTFS